MALPCRPQHAQLLQLPGSLAEANSSLFDVTASPLRTLDWCCTSSFERINRSVPGLLLQEEVNPQPLILYPVLSAAVAFHAGRRPKRKAI